MSAGFVSRLIERFRSQDARLAKLAHEEKRAVLSLMHAVALIDGDLAIGEAEDTLVELAARLDRGEDLAELLSEMAGELNASHMGAGYRSPVTGGDETASLGLYYDHDHAGPGMKIADYLEILSDPERLKLVIREELEEIVKEFGDERRTLIQAEKRASAELKVVDEPVTVFWLAASAAPASAQAVVDANAPVASV